MSEVLIRIDVGQGRVPRKWPLAQRPAGRRAGPASSL